MNHKKNFAAVLGLGALMVAGLGTIGTTPAQADGLQLADINGRISVAHTQDNCAPVPPPYYVAPPVAVVTFDHQNFGNRNNDRDHRNDNQGRDRGNWGGDNKGGDRR